MTKIEPAVQTMTFNLGSTAPGGFSTFYGDLSQIASLYNRRFYRQGLNWAVAGFKFITGGSTAGRVLVYKAPNTWITSNAWEKGMRTWSRMVDEAVSETDSVKPRFMDFKVYLDTTHHQLGSIANLLPTDGGFVPATPGDWDYSRIQVPDSSVNPSAGTSTVKEYDLILMGPNYPGPSPVTGNDAVSLIEGYAAGRALPNVVDPNTPDDARDTAGTTPENWAEAIFNEGLIQDSEVIRDLQTQNTVAPYPFENDGVNLDTMYPGGANQLVNPQLHSFETVSTTTVGGITYVKGGNFPCGLFRIDLGNDAPVGGEDLQCFLQIDLVPGSHRGYLAEPMTEM